MRGVKIQRIDRVAVCEFWYVAPNGSHLDEARGKREGFYWQRGNRRDAFLSPPKPNRGALDLYVVHTSLCDVTGY